MSAKFVRQMDLPQTNVTRDMFYELIETMEPLLGLVDDLSLTVQTGAVRAAPATPYWRKYTVGYADLADSSMTHDIELFLLPPGGIVHGVKIKHSEAFDGPDLSALTLSVGVAGELDRYADAFDVFQAVDDEAFDVSDKGLIGETHLAGGQSVRVAAAATGAQLDALTAGAATIWVLWSATE